MKIAYIGSCLSAQIVRALLQQDPASMLVAGLPHMRLDALHQLWVKKQRLFPAQDDLQKILASLEQEGLLKRNAVRTATQTLEALEDFRGKLGTADCLVVDNHYDLSSYAWSVRQGGREFQLVNLDMKEAPGRFERLGLLPLAGAAPMYQELFDELLEANPALKIVLVQFPIDGYLDRRESADRVARSKQLAKELPAIRNVIHVPMIEMPKDYLLPSKGPHYFTDTGYDVYARLLTRLLRGEKVEDLLRGRADIRALDTALGSAITPKADRPASGESHKKAAGGTNPYADLPTRNYWKPAVGDKFPLGIEGLYDKKYDITADHRVATFGSCFAQHIGHRLKASGFGYMDLEPAPPGLSEKERVRLGYGIYSARYGNVYTSLQMLQLLQRAFGEITLDEVWESGGRFHDPFRPNIFPDGFASPEELNAERDRHLATVRQLFEQLDVMVFTMGLTECWIHRKTGAAYPTAPGVTVGQLDPSVHVFRNFRYEQIRAHMQALIKRLKEVNPKAKLLLTVSPVPLTATYEDRHVLVSTMHSKSVLRAVAGELAEEHDFIDYFPSYEVIASPPYRAMFYQNNLRTVHDDGVNHVMTHFFRQHRLDEGRTAEASDSGSTDDFCDEVFLELSRRIATPEGGTQ